MHKRGYTKAVDMWSLGGVAATILTGTSLFVDSKNEHFKINPDQAIANLAAECNLAHIDHSHDWQHVGERAKDFVRRLLVLDEMKRMTVTEALEHPWFTNGCHKNEFEAVYLRAIRHWKPRPRKPDIIEALNVDRPEGNTFSKGPKSSRKRGLVPIDSPYFPFHRRLDQLVSPRTVAGPVAEPRNVFSAPWKTPIEWINSLHNSASLQNKSLRTDLASVRLRWRTPSKYMTLKGKLESSFTSAQVPNSPSVFSPGTEPDTIPWGPMDFVTDEEDEVALVPTSSPGRKLLALLDDMSMTGIGYHASIHGEEKLEEADVELSAQEGDR